MTTTRALLAATAVALAWPSVAGAQAAAPGDRPVIVARGSGLIKRAPDQAFVMIAAESRAKTPGEAQRLSAEAMTSLTAALRKIGLPASAIDTVGYSLQPDMEYTDGRSRVRGYIARNQIEVQVDDLDKIGPVIDAAGASGATSMSGLRFDLKDRDAAEREALRLAVADAVARAHAMAAGAGANVGAIVRVEEFGSAEPPPMPMMMRSVADAAPQTPVTPGEIEIRAQVSVTALLGSGLES